MNDTSVAREAGVRLEADIILQTLDTVVPDREGSYLAAPISTGRRYFEALHQSGCGDLSSLIERIGNDEYLRRVRWPNVRDGEAVANELRASGVKYLINTGPIYMEAWAGADYMELCYRLLERKVHHVYFHPDWAYSAGAVKEYIFCCERGITRSTVQGTPLDPAAAASALERVRDHLAELGLSTEKAERQLERIRKL